MKTVLFIDGENFIFKIEDSLIASGIIKKKISSENIDLKKLVSLALSSYQIDEINFYNAKLRQFGPTLKKSQELILKQRVLKTTLEKQGVNFIIAGTVQPQQISANKFTFNEKGVDVRIAVDMVTYSCDKIMDRAILCSSDSDLLPAVRELRKREVEVVYVGFENIPNIALSKNSNKTVLIRNAEISQVVPILP